MNRHPQPPGPSRLLGPAQVRALAARLGVTPTKTLGQNFVIDPNTVRRIARAADLTDDDVVVEVGPGLGSLTLALLPSARRLYAVEIDPRLATALPDTVATHAPDLTHRLHVLTADALTVTAADLTGPPTAGSRSHGDSMPPSSPTALVANLPYNVAVPVLLHLLATLPDLRHGLVMVQAEVAERLTAGPGSRVYGVPSAKLAWYAQARPAGAVPRSVFWPVPNVDSGLVAFTRHPGPRLPADVDRGRVFAVVDAAFAQRRKTLRAALGRWAGTPTRAETILRAAGVDPAARGESLTIEEFSRIAAARHTA